MTGDRVKLPVCAHSHPGELTVQQLSLTLSTVAACVALWAVARVLRAAAAIHTPDVTGLNCRGEEREREQRGDEGGMKCRLFRYYQLLRLDQTLR